MHNESLRARHEDYVQVVKVEIAWKQQTQDKCCWEGSDGQPDETQDSPEVDRALEVLAFRVVASSAWATKSLGTTDNFSDRTTTDD